MSAAAKYVNLRLLAWPANTLQTFEAHLTLKLRKHAFRIDNAETNSMTIQMHRFPHLSLPFYKGIIVSPE
jgi:hypothetical protein